MKKLLRFFVVFIMYILMFLILYITLPSIAWLFGGNFLAIVQHPAYAVPVVSLSLVGAGAIIAECFDAEFRSKD